jgi:bifunctional non-homologous end joining protein LigD
LLECANPSKTKRVHQRKRPAHVPAELSRYEPGRRSGIWVKKRINNRQEFVVGGYTPSHLGPDALLVGLYQGDKLRFAGSVRAGFNPKTRRKVHDQIKRLEVRRSPFTNSRDKRQGLWGRALPQRS